MGAPIGLVLPWLTTPPKPMNYIHAENSIVIEYPYSIEKLRSDNPETSFPAVMSEEELNAWGVYSVEEQNPPAYNERLESIRYKGPELNSEIGSWVVKWEKRSHTADEMKLITKAESSIVRTKRNDLLQKSDYTQLNDFPGTESDKLKYQTYRQALRDLPNQEGFPWELSWPVLDKIE